MMAVRGQGTALGGGITVEVDLSGSLVTLAVRDEAARHGGRSVAHAILEAQARAHAQVRERTAELRIVSLRQRYAHVIQDDPALWDKVVRGAMAAATPNCINDAHKRIVEAAAHQLAGG